MASDHRDRRRDPPALEALLTDPGVSRHLKAVLVAWRRRDPVDAARDADLLSLVLGRDADVLVERAP